jgi:carbamoyltransferase
MTAILGVSAFYPDSAAALVVDGRIVAAAQEERFTRKKHDDSFPAHAVEYCLREGGLRPGDLDHVAFYDKPLLKFDRLLSTYVAVAPAGFRSFLRAMPLWLQRKLHTPDALHRGLRGEYRRRFVFAEHHESHAASAFFPSPFDQAAILTLDGVGEWATATFGVGRGNRIELLAEQRFPHSLGLLYSAFTFFTGFRVNSGEYKLMGLAPYGEPVYADRILDELVDLKGDGSFRLDMRYFDYCRGRTMTSARFHDLFGGPPRHPEGPLTRREMDLAASIQQVAEEVVLRAARHVHEVTGMRDLCLAGGVALNCVANGRLLREGPFERLWIQPAAGDAGGALGVALLVWHQLLGNPRTAEPGDAQQGSLLGPRYGPAEVRAALDATGATYRAVPDEEVLCDQVAALLESGRVVGWFQGRMEFGPRALGTRSILGDPRDPGMQSLMNRKIKFRESFRPFAPAVLDDHVDDWFDRAGDEESPYMLLVLPVSAERRVSRTDAPPGPLPGGHRRAAGLRAAGGPGASAARGLAELATVASEIPAVTHVDHSARVQTVDRSRNPRFRRLLERFWARTGCPVLVNTSFNVRGEPIVCTPGDAYRCFMATDLDALVVEDLLLLKEEQDGAGPSAEDHLAQFAPD